MLTQALKQLSDEIDDADQNRHGTAVQLREATQQLEGARAAGAPYFAGIGDTLPTDLADLVWDDREAQTFAAWLGEHPGTQVLCRDRAGAYADGARTGAPQATQVADRWHLWHNLAEHVEKTVLGHRGCLREPLPETPTLPPPVEPSTMAAPAPPEKKIVTRTTQRSTQVQDLRAQGQTISAIARSLHLDIQTVRRFAHATSLDQLLAKTVERASVLDAFHALPAAALDEGLHRRRRADPRAQGAGVCRQRPDRAPLPATLPPGASHTATGPGRPDRA